MGGLDPLAAEAGEAWQVWRSGGGEVAGGHDQEVAGEAAAGAGFDGVVGGFGAPLGAAERGVEEDFGIEVEFSGDVVEIG